MQGLVADYALCEEGQTGAKALPATVARLKTNGTLPDAIYTDRGLKSRENDVLLEKHGIKNGLCERNPELLKKRLEEEEGYARGLKRRGATEARIAILKNSFIGNPSRAKGREHIGQAVGWAVLVHNLWVLARRELALRQSEQQAA